MRFRYWLYYGICSVGLIGVIRGHIRFLYSLWYKENTVYLYEYVGRWADKSLELFFFFLGAIVLLMYSLGMYAGWNRLKSNRTVRVIWRREAWAGIDLAWVTILCLQNYLIGFGYWKNWFDGPGIIIGDFLWLVMICFPAAVTWIIIRHRKTISNNWIETWSGMKKIYALFIFVSFLQLVSLIWPFIAQPLNMMGEYLELPYRTMVNGQYIDNSTYYTEHQLLGDQPRYQLEQDGSHSPRPNPEACLFIEWSPGVERLLGETKNRAAYFYDRQGKLLCNTGPITSDDWLLIRQAATDKDTLIRAEEWLAKDIERGNYWKKHKYSVEELDFIDNNRFALEFQLNGIWVLHHHNFVLGPINEYALGKPQRDIFPQYGWLNMVITSHLMEWFGGISYDKYFKVWYSYFIVYFILLIGVFWLIFRHTGYVALATTMSVGLMSYIPFVWLFQGPGLNPVRHFFDVFVIACFYLYLKKERTFFLIGALFFGILGILNNTQFGLACLGALVASIGVVWIRRAIKYNYRVILIVVVTVILGGYVGLNHPFWSDGPLNKYYLMGISSMPTSASREISILIVYGVATILLCRHIGKAGSNFKYLVLFLVLYSQGALLYSLWGSTVMHYLVLATLHITTFVALLKLEMDCSTLSIRKREISLFFIFACSLALLVYGARSHSESQKEYTANFVQHENFEWGFERAHFTSSMHPQYFADSEALIRKYSTSSAIHIISKYDAILPFLSNKYSAMPFFELSKYFVTPQELNQVIEVINQNRPMYLYVDTDIRRDFTMDVVDPRVLDVNYLHGFSILRVKRLELLQQVFEAVQADYELVEQGSLISVYKRK